MGVDDGRETGTVRRWLSIALAGLLAAGVLVAVVRSVGGRSAAPAAAPAALLDVTGVSGSEKQAFFADPEAVRAFARNGLRLKVDYAGSREIATLPTLDRTDFAFPAGAPAAEKIRREHKTVGRTEPFFTPMAVATFKPLAELLVRNKVARPLAGGYYQLDMRAYQALVAKDTRWTDLAGNTVYPARKAVLVSSTDVRTSNSAAQYLGIASYVANGDNIVTGRKEADKVLASVAPLFLRQGYSASSSEEPFEDYLSAGIGKTPMVMIYEAQYLSRRAAKDGSVGPDMVLMYPDPVILTKHTAVALTANGNRAATLLATDPDLQRLAVKYGFRTSDRAAFGKYLRERGVTEPPAPVDVVEPPTYEVLEYLITRIDQQIKGS